LRKPELTVSLAFDWLELLSQPSANAEPQQQILQRFFVATRLGVGLCALLLLSLSLVLDGLPTLHHLAQFALALTPFVAIAVLKRTGNFELAQHVSICGWIALAASVGASAGGFDSVAVALLMIALIEAALTLEMPAVAASAGIGFALLGLHAALRFLAPGRATPDAATALYLAPLLAYAAALAAGAVRLAHGRAQAERRNAHDLRLLTDALGDIVLHFDRTGAVLALIGDAHKAYGLALRDLMGRGFFQRVHVADRPAFLKLLSDASAAGAPAQATLRLQVGQTPNGGGYMEPIFAFFEARARHHGEARQHIASADPAPIVCVLRDVTAARKAEEELAEARRESELAMAGKTRFLATVSHELRTPLNAIIGFSEMLGNAELEPQEPEMRREYARIISSSGHHLHDVVNTILDMSKIESGAMQLFPEPFSLPALIDQCCKMIQLKADQGGVTLTADCPTDIDEIVADKRACKQIVINLLSNAVKFTPPKGKVAVRLRPEGNCIALSVTDTGIGIAASDLARLGDPFFQASAAHDRAFEGTGLGLSVVRGLVGLHGGAILVESAPRAGTTVTVRLPQDGRLAAERQGAAVKIEAIPRHGAPAPGHDIDRDKVKKIA
jgi:two-component system, cell cycle sensor histidine kinase DivJ